MSGLLFIFAALVATSHSTDPHSKGTPAHGTFHGRAIVESRGTLPFSTARDHVYTAAQLGELARGIEKHIDVRQRFFYRMELQPDDQGNTRAAFFRYDAEPFYLPHEQLREVARSLSLPDLPKLEGRFTITSNMHENFIPQLAPMIARHIQETYGRMFPTFDLSKRVDLIRNIRVMKHEEHSALIVDHVFFDRPIRITDEHLINTAHRLAQTNVMPKVLYSTHPTILVTNRRLQLSDVVSDVRLASQIHRDVTAARASASSTFRVVINPETGLPTSEAGSPRSARQIEVQVNGGDYQAPSVARGLPSDVARDGFELFLRSLRGLP